MLEKQISQREIAEQLNIKPQGLTKLLNKKNFWVWRCSKNSFRNGVWPYYWLWAVSWSSRFSQTINLSDCGAFLYILWYYYILYVLPPQTRKNLLLLPLRISYRHCPWQWRSFYVSESAAFPHFPFLGCRKCRNIPLGQEQWMNKRYPYGKFHLFSPYPI